ncbi:ets DNA-binding protein pokkuri-like [Argiope bruennichi]|uniref:ets DNA-binding protein pokkuri-like n=1 Tax=Argiope bruennichi TaxID=94029 RepID=UPI0024944B57|nr:ets DNA-binding protein pokkuri-like [Argiope bruennichi]XP_055949128.1 ets DNA-binding protein pokkuri-like [Argiope bruennichi]XP_055949129.1 ets DNA-binding protein pokkuri-like [Argiope bruennichi]XP_055949130.1 ets DNA-binding protein pokkuri-like [Argiope bruennichi]XP_055949131.1 ets DNA-binding protein pokkuri-like [Argiope bruennichi]
MVGVSMECSPTIEPAYLNLPGWRCVPVYAVPLSPTSRTSPTSHTPPPLEAHNLLPPNIPQDPRQWSRQHVFTWLEWCVENFALPPLDIDQFYMNGRGLCLLKKSDFCDRSPRSGDILYNALQILLPGKEKPKDVPSSYANNVSASLLQHATQEKGNSAFPSRMGSAWPRSISSDFHSMGHVVHESEHAQVAVSHLNGSDVDSTTASSPPPPIDDTDRSPERGCIADGVQNNSKQAVSTPDIRHLSQFGEIGNSSEKINVRLLWDFLQQLLNDAQQRYQCCIVWKDKGRGIFKITDPHRLAALWGKQKNHLNMNFDKMSRALRYYYRVRILQKEPGERHCYRFLRHPNELRHCKQRALLTRDTENGVHNGVHSDVEAALDMSIKEEGLSPGEAE